MGDPEAEVEVTGRLVGGWLEVLGPLAGTLYLDPGSLADRGDGLIVYVEAAESDAFQVCRVLHGMRLVGFFDRADAVLVGRTSAPDRGFLTLA